jgi:acetylornithine/succinyldiaminopimelate/putrescine aminotransferase
MIRKLSTLNKRIYLGISNTNLKKFKNNNLLKKTINNSNIILKKEVLYNLNINTIQKNFNSFYEKKYTQPYIPIYAEGPWVGIGFNQVIYDTGGYGMLSFGHNDKKILQAISKPQVMANIMTPNINQYIFTDKLNKEIGNSINYKPYSKYMCLNSGSEINTLALRIANIHNNKNPVTINLKGSFHGRTEGPAVLSDSCRNTYNKHLNQFELKCNNYSVEPNNINDLKNTFNKIITNNQFPELFIMEPVMGEGMPGLTITPEFYKEVRRLTKENNCLLLVDSIQAGFRCYGDLSIVDYPHFKNLEPPDMESFSKTINGGQFPLSVLALSSEVSSKFKKGLYGNTMTTNPRALHISSIILDKMNSNIKNNIVDKGNLLKYEFIKLKQEFEFIESVTGTGLLLAIHINEKYPVSEIELILRKKGLNVIHGGKNAIRFTPWFLIDNDEINLIINILRQTFLKL